MNNPVRYTDPTGHLPTQGCGDEGKDPCVASDLELADNSQKLAVLLYDPTGQKQQRNTTIAETILYDGAELVASIFFEPADWAFSIYHCLNGECNAWVLLGVLPFIPSGTGRYTDDVVDLSARLTGQNHHILSTKIIRTLNKHEVLSGVFRRDDMIVQAADLASHRGYQGWHRAYDDQVVRWLTSPPGQTASVDDFLLMLTDLHLTSEMQQRFPTAVQTIFNTFEALP